MFVMAWWHIQTSSPPSKPRATRFDKDMSTQANQSQPRTNRMRGRHLSATRNQGTSPSLTGEQPTSNTQAVGGRPPNAANPARLGVFRVIIPSDLSGFDEDLTRHQFPGSDVPCSPNCQLPPLARPSGPPIKIEGLIGGSFIAPTGGDPRILAVSMGFPISIHPLRVPNTRTQHSSGSTHSVINLDFVRIAGLLHTMAPLRHGIDDVKLESRAGSLIDIKGYVDVVFDAFGFEFEQRCWVMRLGFPLELQLGNDWAVDNHIRSSFTRGYTIEDADAKRVRDLEDVYVVR